MKRPLLLSRNAHAVLTLSGVLAAVMAVPIPLGSNRPYAWFGFEFAVYSLVAFWALGAACYREFRPFPAPVARILLVLAVWLACLLLQTVALPQDLVEALNPVVHRLRQDLGVISVSAPSTLSIDPATSFNEFLKYGAYIAVFVLIVATVTNRTRLLWGVGALVAAGVLEALFGLYTHLFDFVIFPETSRTNELRVGTFVNRNHYANLLTMVLAVVFGLITAVVNSQGEGNGLKIRRYSDSSFALLLVLAVAALTILAGIFISGSRAPIVFFSLSFAVMLALARGTRRAATGEFVLAPVIILGAVVVILSFGFDYSVMRLVDRSLFGGERMIQNFAGFDLLSAVWLAGAGAGNYRWMFPMFRGDELRFVTYDHAHNDYLQVAIEQGLPVAVLLGAAVFLIVREMYRGYRYRRNPVNRGIIFGCLMGVIFMLLHAMVEFNFRIPANAVYFFAIAAIGVAACRIDRGAQRRHATQPHSERR